MIKQTENPVVPMILAERLRQLPPEVAVDMLNAPAHRRRTEDSKQP